jgi:hypothetical protein
MKNVAGAYLLSAADGRHVDIRGGRGPWILLVAHGPHCEQCRDYADALVAARTPLQEWGARLAIVLHDPLADARNLREQLDATIEVFSDPEQSLAAPAGSLLVTDEWGDVFHSTDAGPDHAFPAPAEVAQWVQFVAIQCPECEQPEGFWKDFEG